MEIQRLYSWVVKREGRIRLCQKTSKRVWTHETKMNYQNDGKRKVLIRREIANDHKAIKEKK